MAKYSINNSFNQFVALLLFCIHFIVNISVTIFIFHQFLLWFYGHENISQLYNLKHHIVIASFLPDSCFVKTTSSCLNSNYVLHSCVDFALQSIITLTANFLSIKNQLGCFSGSSTISYLCFLWSE